MWGTISKHWQVVTATVFSVVLIFSAYIIARGIEFPRAAQASTETELLKAIATKDSDSDGLPDWEEALYGTDSNVADTFHLGMTDGDAVTQGLIVPKAVATVSTATSSQVSLDTDGLSAAPAAGTLTALFSQNFLSIYLAAKETNNGADLTDSQMNDVATQAMNSLPASVTTPPPYKTRSDLTISEDSSPEAFKTFAASAEAVLMKNTSDATNTDLDYFKDALLNNHEASAFPHILSIARAYRASATGLAKLPVPKALAEYDLALINTLMHLSEVDIGFTYAGSSSDPLVAIIALHQYIPTVTALSDAFTNIGNVYAANGVFIPADTQGASFVSMSAAVASAVAKQPKEPPIGMTP